MHYTASALEAAAALSKRYISDRFLPDKAIDVMDEAASKKKVGLFTMPDALKKAEEEAKKFSQRKRKRSWKEISARQSSTIQTAEGTGAGGRAEGEVG